MCEGCAHGEECVWERGAGAPGDGVNLSPSTEDGVQESHRVKERKPFEARADREEVRGQRVQ